jgi:hypothetical protein
MALNVDLFGDPIESELPDTGILRASGAKTAPRPIDKLSLFARVHLIVMSYVLIGGVETVMSRQFGMISRRQGYLLASRATRGPQKPKQEHILQPQRMTQ